MSIKQVVKTPIKMSTMSLRELTPYARNTKMHPVPQIKQLIKSIREFGFMQPILVDSQTKVIIAGHGRYQAARQMGLQNVPVIEVDHLTEAQLKAYNIADNQLTMNTGFDMEMLQGELAELAEFDMDLSTLGFTAGDIDEIFGGDFGAAEEIPEEEIAQEEIEGWKGNPLIWTAGEHLKFPTNNEFGIPLLDVDLQPTYIDTPVTVWGSVARDKIWGTAICYSEDWRFEGLWNDPHVLMETHATMATEPNFSTWDDMPLAVALWQIFRKRTIARYWQSQGLPVIVDLFVVAQFMDVNFLGVPAGWGAFSVRAADKDYLLGVYDYTCKKMKRKPDVFFVYGGGRMHAELCGKMGWTHQIEHMQIADQLKGGDYEADREDILDKVRGYGKNIAEKKSKKETKECEMGTNAKTRGGKVARTAKRNSGGNRVARLKKKRGG